MQPSTLGEIVVAVNDVDVSRLNALDVSIGVVVFPPVYAAIAAAESPVVIVTLYDAGSLAATR
jgi:hypothetical protein